jgi:hypothetical protein
MTVVELMAAMAIAGLVLLGALLLLDSVSDSVRRIDDDAASVIAAGAQSGLLHQLLNDAAATFDSSKRYEGDERGFSFWTRCAQPQGWMAPCRVGVTIADGLRGSAFRVSFENGDERTLQHYDHVARLRYFDSDHEAWRAGWSASATIPAALELVAGNDTMVYSMGSARE